MADFWRVRMKVGGRYERSTQAWDRGEVGAWYGAWTAADWAKARVARPGTARPGDLWSFLKDCPNQKQLGWNSTPDIAAVCRLEAIGPDDWVVVFLRDRGEIGLARLEPGLHSEKDHPLNQIYDDDSFEVFKFRRLVDRKIFPLVELPDAYRLLPAQGRGNLHQFHGMRSHVQLLADHPDAQSVRQALAGMEFDQLIDILGASAWESVCTAYLTLEHSFVPTGLRTGSTLPVLDIVGRSAPSGAYILAQCKKSPGPVPISDDFVAAVGHHSERAMSFYFAFGGCQGTIPENIKVIGKEEILAWVQTERGAMYRGFLVGT